MVATYCRDAILARAMPEPEVSDVATLPAWLLHFLLFVTRGARRSLYSPRIAPWDAPLLYSYELLPLPLSPSGLPAVWAGPPDHTAPLNAAGCGDLLPTMEATAAVLNINVGQVCGCSCLTDLATTNLKWLIAVATVTGANDTAQRRISGCIMRDLSHLHPPFFDSRPLGWATGEMDTRRPETSV